MARFSPENFQIEQSLAHFNIQLHFYMHTLSVIFLGSYEDGNEMLPDQVHLKVLVPSIAAGAIIGKGGETITQIQKETGANIKMSKANDFYPGTYCAGKY